MTDLIDKIIENEEKNETIDCIFLKEMNQFYYENTITGYVFDSNYRSKTRYPKECHLDDLFISLGIEGIKK